jgi:uncharacterized protein (TIRG00374 family)
MPLESVSSRQRTSAQNVLLVLTGVVSIACLVWVLHDIDTESLNSEIARMQWGWVAVAVIADILVYFWHGWRWSLLLSPLAHVPFWRSVRAIYVGLFANEVLPFRTGELIRCYLMGKWSDLPFTVTLSSALVERIFDGAWLIFCLLVTVSIVDVPEYIVDGATILGVFLLAGALLVAAAMFAKQKARAVFERNRILRKLNIVIDDLNLIGHSRYVWFSALASLPYLLMQIVPIWALAKGYPGIDFSLAEAFAIMVFLRLGSVIPQAPGNIGTFQALTVVALQLFAVDVGIAKRFSLVMWSIITLPLLVTGFIALAVTGLKMADLRHHAHTSAKGLPRTEANV